MSRAISTLSILAFQRCKHSFVFTQGMVYHGRVELLSHDLSQKYLQMKWNAYGKYIHFSHLVLYLCYLGILTSFASGYLKRNRQEGIDGGGSGVAGENIIHGPILAAAGGDVNYLDRSQAELAIDLLGNISNSGNITSNRRTNITGGDHGGGGDSANHFIHSTRQPSHSESSTTVPTSINGSSGVSNKHEFSIFSKMLLFPFIYGRFLTSSV